MVLYKKIFIREQSDLPKEEGEYFCNRSGFKSVQRISPDLPIKSYIREIRWYLIALEKTEPRAFEWHNYETGHCYVDYIPHPGQDEKDGYTKIPLYSIEQHKT